MGKKLILLGMAVAAVAAFAMPAVASADFTLTDHEGKVGVGEPIIGTSTNAVTTNTALGKLTCDHVEITGIVTANSGTHAAAIGGEVGKTTECFAEGTIPLTITEAKLLTLTTAGDDEGTLSMTYIADVGPFECHFDGTGRFTYGTGTGEDKLHIPAPGITLTSAEICEPEEGSPHFTGDFTLTTEDEDGNPAGEVWIEPGA